MSWSRISDFSAEPGEFNTSRSLQVGFGGMVVGLEQRNPGDTRREAGSLLSHHYFFGKTWAELTAALHSQSASAWGGGISVYFLDDTTTLTKPCHAKATGRCPTTACSPTGLQPSSGEPNWCPQH